VKLCSNF